MKGGTGWEERKGANTVFFPKRHASFIKVSYCTRARELQGLGDQDWKENRTKTQPRLRQGWWVLSPNVSCAIIELNSSTSEVLQVLKTATAPTKECENLLENQKTLQCLFNKNETPNPTHRSSSILKLDLVNAEIVKRPNI